ncbi:penicillin-insensitive murein endopeptidase [Psychromonas aquimarina]|uniref:penicillin-insensitive murein endopeptidase n=1 Tax=Psychromonas aquimarina TaxID=444919 RepID=UPI00040424F1|nr:penicillin-insensitive murein endopeptidase [Psychromonas aquimarina]
MCNAEQNTSISTLWLMLKSITVMIICITDTAAASWHDFDSPYPHPPEAIGFYNNGCLSGAQALPLQGEGFQVIRASRHRYYGHPELIEFITDFAAEFKSSSGNNLLIGDISMPRGGRFISGHSSHQIGLDVDVWFQQTDSSLSAERLETPQALDLTNQKEFKVNSNWQNKHAAMIQLAAEDKRVARIFVNPVIKQQLCQMPWHDDNWLNKVRPWWGHSIHMHIRLTCPKDSKLCTNQPVPAPGNGCNEIAWWKSQPKLKSSSTKTAVKVKPEQCRKLLSTPG